MKTTLLVAFGTLALFYALDRYVQYRGDVYAVSIFAL